MKRYLIVIIPLIFGFVSIQAQEKRAEYYDNGEKKWEGHVLGSKKMGEWVYYYDNGNTMREGIYKDGQVYGEWTEYWRSGQVKSKGHYIVHDGESVRHGDWIWYHRNGAEMKKGAFRAGKPVGTWYEYNNLGIQINKKEL